MFTRRSASWLALPLALALVASCTASASGADVSTYRGFRLGMPLTVVATEASVPITDARTIVERPLLIQELLWRPPDAVVAGASPARDTVSQVLFGFCNGELYRMVVTYEPDQTEGMTEGDLIDALSAAYGPTRTPPVGTVIITSPASQGYNDTHPVVARWEDAVASVNLYHGTYRSAFGLVIFSKSMAPVARNGVESGLRLARLQAPQREAAEQKMRDDADRASHALARAANKATFRY